MGLGYALISDDALDWLPDHFRTPSGTQGRPRGGYGHQDLLLLLPSTLSNK